MQSSSNMSLSKAGEPMRTVSKIAQGPVEHQTSHSERSLLDLLGCEEKEVNLEQSVGDLEATTKYASLGITKYANATSVILQKDTI